MTRLILLLCILGFPIVATAEQDPAQCLYDFQCDGVDVCKAGRCVRPGYVPQSAANDLCGGDRRCRIERLKRTNAARRQLTILSEEETTRRVVEEARQEITGPQPRLDTPLVVDWRISRAGIAGLLVGYGLTPQIAVEGHAFFYEDYFYEDSSYDVELTFIGASAVLFTNPDQVAGYASIGFNYVFGSALEYGFSSFFANDTVMHTLELQAGVDVHSNLGFHTRLGAAYRPLLYHRVTTSPGVYNEVAEKDMEGWFTDNAMIDIVFLIGWAF